MGLKVLPVSTFVSGAASYCYRSVFRQVEVIRMPGAFASLQSQSSQAAWQLAILQWLEEESAIQVSHKLYGTGTSKVPGICCTLAVLNTCLCCCWAHIPCYCSLCGPSVHLVSIGLLLLLPPHVLCLLSLSVDDLLVWWVFLKSDHFQVLRGAISATAHARVFLRLS